MAEKMASAAALVVHERFGADRTITLRKRLRSIRCLCRHARASYARVPLARSCKKGTFMSTTSAVLAALVAVEHLGFLVLEMFLWQKPIGLRVFRLSPDVAAASAALAANQGLYNGFLAAGIVAGLAVSDPGAGFALIAFSLSCVIVAGIFGAFTVSWRTLALQTVPGAVALGALVFLR
jgi:putative membrane protein